MDAPSILDYIKSLFSKNKQIHLDEIFEESQDKLTGIDIHEIKEKSFSPSWVMIGLILAIIGQFLLEPPIQHVFWAICLYVLAIIFVSRHISISDAFYNFRVGEWNVQIHQERISITALIISVIFLTTSFFLFNNNKFDSLNLCFWLLGIYFLFVTFWMKKKSKQRFNDDQNIFFILIIIGVFMISGFFRFYRLGEVPAEMFSDHAEKLLDVMDILSGQNRIFFPRNTGREALQFYMTALIIRLFNTEISFLSLKIGTAAAGFLTLPFIYCIGKELFNKWAGLFAMLFAGISYWHNVVSRIGLRFPLYPLFVSAALLFFIKGFKRKDRNYFILSGLITGLGLHGYSPFRIVPVFIVLFFGIYIFLNKNYDLQKFGINGVMVYSIFTVAVFLPLLRYMVDFPGYFNYRALSRITSIEKTLDSSILLTFLENTWKSLTMFFYNNGVTWVTSIPNRPALEFISASFFAVGMIFIIKRMITMKKWEDVLIVLSIPVLMMPSILSLAYPQENPALNRSSGALVPVFLISGLGFYVVFFLITKAAKNIFSKWVFILTALLLIFISIQQNYKLVFNDFSKQYQSNAWNTSEIGEVIKKQVAAGIDPANIFVVPFPHWVDTRLVGINAGYPQRDFALWPEQFDETLIQTGRKLFIVKPEDQQSMDAVELLYPWAVSRYYYSKVPGKDFILISIQNQ